MPNPRIIIHIAPAGNPLSGGGSSAVGHMWFTLQDSFGNTENFGFAPRNPGEAVGAGKIHTDDSDHYIGVPYNYGKDITEAQYDAIRNWVDRAIEDSEAGKGRWDYYNGLMNSCVDFAWEAMNRGGLTDTPEIGWQGNILPWFNRWDVERKLKPDDITNPTILHDVSEWFRQATNPPRRDPLAIDLPSSTPTRVSH